MSAPRCKIGDRVIVIAPAESAILGWFGTVCGSWNPGSRVDGLGFYVKQKYADICRTWWIVELSAPVQLTGDDGSQAMVRRVPYPDVWLQPIRGDTLPQVQEKEQCLTAS